MTARYAELHCKTNFSFLRGASHPQELAERAAELGYSALAVTDRHSLAGVVRAHLAAKERGLKLIVGAELHPIDAPSMALWASDRAGYGRLCRLLTLGNARTHKGDCRLTAADVMDHSAGLLVGVLLGASLDERATVRAAAASLAAFRECFGDRCYALAELHRGPQDDRRLGEMQAVAAQSRVPLVAANDAHYHTEARRLLHDVLTAVRSKTTVAGAVGALFPNAERRLLSRQALAERFATAPAALDLTNEIAGRCSFSLDELRYEYPHELCPEGESAGRYLARLTWDGARERYPEGVPEKVTRALEHELAIVAELNYEAYFLTVWDLVRFARARGILCQGRGSAANSAVCYCLGITSVDPTCTDLLFERFISVERNEPPDIDVDFEHERREEVIQYLYERYGRERAGLTAEVISYRPRSAVRDVGKALGLSLDRVGRLAKALGHWGSSEPLDVRMREAGLDPASPTGRRLQYLVGELIGFPRHLGQHVGGMVLTEKPLCEIVPIQNAAMPDRTVVEWDKDDLDALGILKVDVLALGMLTAIRKCFALIGAHDGRDLTLANVPTEDAETYAIICRADTVGVFQIESRAQMSMLPRLQPRTWYDLVIEIAIIRPGPITGQMVHPYLRRRQGREKPDYPSPEVKAVLERTLGVPLFQEQVMALAVAAAGFTPGEADRLRRAMAAWKRGGHVDRYRDKLISGMLERGHSRDFAERIFKQIEGFSGYGFPESHSASFAHLAYVSSWLKCHYPAAFCVALLNSQPMGFYAPAQLVADARKHGVEVRPPDVNASRLDSTLEPGPNGWAVRLGLREVNGLSSSAVEALVEARRDGPYATVSETLRRARLRRRDAVLLAKADAFASIDGRRAALWHASAWGELGADGLYAGSDPHEPDPSLSEQPPLDAVLDDYRYLGLSLKNHPLAFLRAELAKRGVVTAARVACVAHGRWAKAAGLVLVRQQPATAKGVRFITLEDETGVVNLIVRREVYERDRYAGRASPLIVAEGRVQNVDGVVHILALRLADAEPMLAGLRSRSREFH